MNEEDIRKQLEEKNKEIYLNKLNLDLTNNIEVLLLAIDNLLNNIEINTKDRILNIAESFQNEKVIKENIHIFLEKYKVNLVDLINAKKNNIEELISKNTNLSDYKELLIKINNNIKDNIDKYFLNNIDSLVNKITILYDDEFCNLRIREYLKNVLKDTLEDKIMDTINGRDIILINTFNETYLKYQELNKNTIGE